MKKFEILINIVDKIRKEAPADNKIYYPKKGDEDGLNKARSLAYIHLFLNSKFGLVDFVDRQNNYITDDKHDGGVDAFFIDEKNKTLYFIQSKWRINENNLEENNISADDLAKMEVGLILKGSPTYLDEAKDKKNLILR